jgi:hypothetical protein
MIWQSQSKTTQPAGDNPGADREPAKAQSQLQTQPESKSILIEHCKASLKAFSCNHGKIYRKHIKHA